MCMKKLTNDLVIVGGGAAGLMAAATAAEKGLRVLLLEKNDRDGKKLLITGKGRCNVTNACSAETVLKNVPRNGRFLYGCIFRYPPEAAMAFFEENGCPLKVERGNRVFPQSDRSSDVLQALERALRRGGVERRQTSAVEILTQNGAVCAVKTKDGPIACENVLLATGGRSYPLTGSTGDGYRMAERLGHTVVPPTGSLVPMEAPAVTGLQGLSLRNTGLTLRDGRGKAVYRDFGELLFTHFGLSGPTVLSASAHCKPGERYTVELDLKPALDAEKLEARMLRDLKQYCNRSMENALADLYPHALIPALLDMAQIDPFGKANALTREKRQTLLRLTKAFPIAITGLRPVDEAIITRGGVNVREVDPKTMESKLVRGLYFAGEILDCDAYTGGFNLQIAWATAHAAAISCAERLQNG